MPYAKIPRGRMHYTESGQGEPVVLLHGFSLDGRMWVDQIPVLADRYRVLAPDAIGHGRSDTPQTGYSRAHRVEDLAGFVDRLNIERLHLVGLSMGGATAIGYALSHQERLRSLTLVSTSVAGWSATKKFERLDRIGRDVGPEAAKQQWIDWCKDSYRGVNRDLGKRLKIMMDGYSAAVWRDPMRGQYPREYDLEKVHEITIPTAIFAGEQDTMFAPVARKLASSIPGSRLTVYPDAGHMLAMEIPDTFNRDLRSFLDKVTSS